MLTEIDGIGAKLLQQITADQAWYYRIIPGNYHDGSLNVYMDKVRFHNDRVEELEVLLGKKIQVNPIDSDIIEKFLHKHYPKYNQQTKNKPKISEVNTREFALDLISEAQNSGSSDVHLEIYDTECRIRFRIDGRLIEKYILDKENYPSLINRIKILSNLDIAEKRLPQDGRIFFRELDQKLDIRVSVSPTMYGEKVVLRLLGTDASDIDIRILGFSESELGSYLQSIKRPNGIILISGPTGSGKTTTLYATLKELNSPTHNILTIEDPIEYTLDGINQTQLKPEIGLTFPMALKTFLRQDPDIIMVGEIRDPDTAEMAIRAAMTGHLVLSTIHTNSAWGTVSRLADMGIPAFLLASTLNATIAQRLVRKLCQVCKKEEKFNEHNLPSGFIPPFKVQKHFVPVGCSACYYTGYKGRKAIYEVIVINHELSEKIRLNQPNIDTYLKGNNIYTLKGNAFKVFAEGISSIEEIYPLLLY
jgi:type IV pilus assembly protein PilB